MPFSTALFLTLFLYFINFFILSGGKITVLHSICFIGIVIYQLFFIFIKKESLGFTLIYVLFFILYMINLFIIKDTIKNNLIMGYILIIFCFYHFLMAFRETILLVQKSDR